LRKSAREIVEARLFPVATQIVSTAFAIKLGITTNTGALLVRFAGNEKGVAFQIEQALALLRNAEAVMNDAQLWKMIAAEAVSEGSMRVSGATTLTERVKQQLDPLNILPRINAD
jgi:hypothetical protein